MSKSKPNPNRVKAPHEERGVGTIDTLCLAIKHNLKFGGTLTTQRVSWLDLKSINPMFARSLDAYYQWHIKDAS